MVAAFPRIFPCSYHFLAHLKSIFTTGTSWKITQVRWMLTWLAFVKSEEENPLGLLLSILSLLNHLLWGLSSCLLLLGRISIGKWGLRPNIKVQAFAPTIALQNFNFSLLPEEKKYNFDLQIWSQLKPQRHSNLRTWTGHFSHFTVVSNASELAKRH